MQDGFYDNSVLMRLSRKVLEQIEQDCEIVIKIDGYTVETEIKERGVEYE